MYIHDRFFVECVGPSMYPTLSVLGERLIVKPIHPSDAKLGDLVVLNSPTDPGKRVIKRIVALPGTRAPDPLSRKGTTVVPHGQVWLAGDSERYALDSRHWGPVPLSLIQKRVVCRASFTSPDIPPPPTSIIEKYNLPSSGKKEKSGK